MNLSSSPLDRWHSRPFLGALSLSLALFHPFACHGVVFYSTSDSEYHTSAPAEASLVNSGWQYQGTWGSFLGTPIAPNLFITASHVGGGIGDIFTYQGLSYSTTAAYTSTTSDLRIWQVSAAFSSYAPLYTSGDEVGQPLVVMGRGTRRGAEVLNSESQPAGWLWGTADQRMRWGENDVASVVDGGASLGQLLQATFDRPSGLRDEAHLSIGDSGGGVFIKDTSDGLWKLAGINYGVDAYFSLAGGSDPGFNAALYDMGGFYLGTPGDYTLLSNTGQDVPSSFYSTRISANSEWINGVISAVPETSMYGVFVGLGLAGLAVYRVSKRNLGPDQGCGHTRTEGDCPKSGDSP
jgi:hypothetical protein